jgi:small subunit ribosomal protein S1
MQHLDRWDAADQKRRAGEPVEAQVTEANRRGLIVGLLGLRGFLPMSQVAPDAAADWKALVGKTIRVEVLEVNRRRNRVVVRQIPPSGPTPP